MGEYVEEVGVEIPAGKLARPSDSKQHKRGEQKTPVRDIPDSRPCRWEEIHGNCRQGQEWNQYLIFVSHDTLTVIIESKYLKNSLPNRKFVLCRRNCHFEVNVILALDGNDQYG